jgi:hypothetical protein
VSTNGRARYFHPLGNHPVTELWGAFCGSSGLEESRLVDQVLKIGNPLKYRDCTDAATRPASSAAAGKLLDLVGGTTLSSLPGCGTLGFLSGPDSLTRQTVAVAHYLFPVYVDTPVPALQAQMRNGDVRRTLRIYAHVVQQTQRDAMEGAAIMSTAIGTGVPIGKEADSHAVSKQ